VAESSGHGNELSGSIRGDEVLVGVSISFSRRSLLHGW
jgi:hypothetical protein